MTDPVLDGHGYALGRTVWHDEASRLWPAAWHRIRTAEWRLADGATVLDQGQVGSCTANALAHALNTRHLQAARARHGHEQLLDEAAAVDLYSAATRVDPYVGEYPPTDTGSSGLAVCKVAKWRGLLTSYRHAFGLQAALRAVSGGPVIIGVGWRESMFTPRADATLGAVLEVAGQVAGGHEVCLDAIDTDRRMVRVLNSWSSLWAWHGRAWLSWDDLGTLLDDGGDCTVPVAG